jgi:hypothetical protein
MKLLRDVLLAAGLKERVTTRARARGADAERYSTVNGAARVAGSLSMFDTTLHLSSYLDTMCLTDSEARRHPARRMTVSVPSPAFVLSAGYISAATSINTMTCARRLCTPFLLKHKPAS